MKGTVEQVSLCDLGAGSRVRGGFRSALNAAWLMSLAAVCGALTARPLFAQTPTATATAAATPNFDDIDDPLNGQRVLADVVNLVVNNPGYSNNQTTEQNIILATNNGSISGSSIQSIATVDCQTSSSGLPFPQVTRLVRLFNQANDVIVTLAPTTAASGDNCATGTNNMALTVHDTLNSAHDTTTSLTLGTPLVQLGVGDFNQDGFDDLLVANDAELFVVTAADVNTPSSGLAIGAATSTGSTDGVLAEPAVGDFNDDGILDVAWITGPYSGSYNVQETVNFASICPGSVANTVCAGASALQVILNPLSSTPISLYYDDGATILHIAAVVAGNFTSTAGAELMVGYPNGSPSNEVAVDLYDFDGQMVPTRADQVNLYPDDDLYLPFTVYGAATYVGFGGLAQAVFGFGGSYDDNDNLIGLSGVAVVSYNGSSLDVQSYVKVGGATTNIQGFAVGILGTPAGGFTTASDYAPDVALLIGSTLDLYSVNATTYAPTPLTNYSLTGFLNPQNNGNPNCGSSWLRAGDLTGASVVVGDPEIVRVSDTSGANGQPQLVLSMPPQHVDYILASGMTATNILNFTTVDTYASSYSTEVTDSSQSSNTTTTSYTHSVTSTDSETGKISFVASASLPDTVTQTTSVSYSNSISDTYNTYSSAAFDASTATTSTDLIWVTFQDYNIYNYPILGQTACPLDDSDCTTPSQVYFTISGPDDTFTTAISANTVEWYQPVQEPLQVFSYPCSETELSARLPSPSLLTTGSPTAFYTDDSIETESVSWSAGQGSEVTTGSSSTESFNTNTSVTIGTPTLECTQDGADLTDSLDYGNSTAFSTLYSSVTMVGASTGFSIAKPGTFINDALYSYQVQPFIVGESTPSGVVDDTISLDTVVQTSGMVQAMFVANPTASGSGSWWQSGSSYATDIDVAVNHPARWTTAVYSEFSSSALPSPCLSRGAAGDAWCAAFNYYTATDDLWDNEFYWMRGLLVTVGGLAGPQTTNATDGDTVYLQANVYNYSLTDMPSSDTIHVRFYSQEVDDNNDPIGDSVLLNSGGEDILVDPLPAFASTTSTDPNYTTVTMNFSTAGLGDTYQIFWVVVWVEDSNGNLVSEVPGHGLSSLPGTLTCIDDVPLEMVTFTDTLNADTVTTTSFSNNVGYLHQAMYIAASDATTSAAGAALRAQGRGADLQSQDLRLTVSASSRMPHQHDTVSLSGSLISGAARDGVVVLFYDGDPERTAAFDTEVVPHLRADVPHAVRVPYHARTCGAHDLTLIAAPGKSDEVRASVHLDVRCAAPATPTATIAPTATPRHGNPDDDGCAIGPRPAGGIGLSAWLAGAALLALGRALSSRRRVRIRPERPSIR